MTYAATADIYVVPPHLSGHPDVVAMIGAFFSRSYRPMRERVAELGHDVDRVREKLSQYVVGYGHDSILDMANATVAIEGIPILAAMAIEDHALFAGQETSTRYCDWSREAFVNPLPEGTPAHQRLEEHYAYLRNVYVGVQKTVEARILAANHDAVFSADGGDGDVVAMHKRAIRARSFDVARGFLPAGAITRVCWSGRLSSMKAHLRDLAIHPDPNISALAHRIWRALHDAYPHALGSRDLDRSTDPDYATVRWIPGSGSVDRVRCVSVSLSNYRRARCSQSCALENRGWCEPVPANAFPGVAMEIVGRLDLGSYRDLHRHRRGTRTYALRDPVQDLRLHDWYGEMAGDAVDYDEVRGRTEDAIDEINMMLVRERAKGVSPQLAATSERAILAHALPLASEVPFAYHADVPQVAYLVERRTTMDVHGTLRHLMLGVADDPEVATLPLRLHPTRTADPGPAGYVLTRGKQTITVGGRDVGEEK